jgi:hypothetical protein
MNVRDWILRVTVPSVLLVYVLPALLMTFAAVSMWIQDLHKQDFKAGAITGAFVLLIAQSNGPLGLIQKAVSVMSSAAIVATLWSAKDRLLDFLLVLILTLGVVSSLIVWWILLMPDIYREAWQSVSLPNLVDSRAFGAIRDQYFTNEITTLASFGAVLMGIKLKGS